MPVRLRGQENFVKDLDRMIVTAKREFGELVKATAEHIASESRQRYPSDTGKLRSSIVVETNIVPQAGAGITKNEGPEQFVIGARVVAVPFHAFPVEWGYKGREGRGNRGHHLPIEKIGGKWRVKPDLAAWAVRHGKPPWAVAIKRLKKGQVTQGRRVFTNLADEEREPFLQGANYIVSNSIPKAGSSSGTSGPSGAE